MKWVKLLIVIQLLFWGTGCSVFVGNQEEEVAEYNNLIETTISNYTKVKQFASRNKEEMLNYVLKNQHTDLLTSSAVLEPMSDEDIEYFSRYAEIYDKYFTSIGATGVRQVVVITAKDKLMYITAVWGMEGILHLDRVVSVK